MTNFEKESSDYGKYVFVDLYWFQFNKTLNVNAFFVINVV